MVILQSHEGVAGSLGILCYSLSEASCLDSHAPNNQISFCLPGEPGSRGLEGGPGVFFSASSSSRNQRLALSKKNTSRQALIIPRITDGTFILFLMKPASFGGN